MNNNRPTVSVIIPTYNRARLIGRAIRSILNQTYNDFEVIIVDDGSQDNTKEVVERFTDKRIRYIRLEKNMGAGAARNKGIEASRGKYIGFQDSDDEWLPEKLKKQVDILNSESSNVGYVYSDMWRVLSNGKQQYWGSPTITVAEIINQNSFDYQVFNLGILATLIKMECFEKSGIFDERFPRLIDLDFFIRLAKDFRSYHVKEPLVRYYETDGISSDHRAYAVGRMMLLEKYYEQIKKNRKFLSNQFFLIGKNFCLCGDAAEGKKYLRKAIVACPLYKPPIMFQLKMIVGDATYSKLWQYWRWMRKRRSLA